ncbi:MAG TPA: ornithine acetyltransferase [Desulfobacteraceae bacterium]|nr:ornithine acetyltransferase [Desulfobacteraceae bacterium]
MNNSTICPGFMAAGIAAQIKKKGVIDLGLIYSEKDASVAGVFTNSLVQAAPVILDKKRVESGKCRAIIVNSGNANCCTGEQGMVHAVAMTEFIASRLNLPEEKVLVASTGVIGEPFPINRVKTAVPGLIEALNPHGFKNLARSIMTTDTVEKLIFRHKEINGKKITIAGVAKGAGMIRPDMATMLCFICTDAGIAPDLLHTLLLSATKKSFNKITIDGDTSTNDTVIIMANNDSRVTIENKAEINIFQQLLDDLLLSLAKMLVKDGEGVTKFVEVIVKGAENNKDAGKIADTIANSNLVKTAFFGEDANWGRIIAAAGRAGAQINQDLIDIYFDDVMMVKNGMGCGKDVEALATKVLKKSEFVLTIDLKIKSGSASVFTCDFSVDYVKINADYRT